MAGGGGSRWRLCGLGVCRWKIRPSPVRWVGVGSGSGAVRAWGGPPADAAASPSDPAPRSWWLLRFFNAFGLGVRLLPGLVLLAAGFFGVVDGGEDARLVTLRLKLGCASFAFLVSSLFFYLLVFGSVLCFLLFNTSMKNQKKKKLGSSVYVFVCILVGLGAADALFRAATEKNEQKRYFSQSVLVMIPLLVIAY